MPAVSCVFAASVSNSRVASAISGAGASLRMSNPVQLALELAEGARRAVGDQQRFAHRNGELAPFAQGDRDVEDHAGLQRHMDVVIEPEDIAFAPIRREGNADAVAGALAIAAGEVV